MYLIYLILNYWQIDRYIYLLKDTYMQISEFNDTYCGPLAQVWIFLGVGRFPPGSPQLLMSRVLVISLDVCALIPYEV